METNLNIRLVTLMILAMFLTGLAGAQTCPEGDFNNNCTVNLEDMVIFAQYWLDRYDLIDFAVLADSWYQSEAPLVISEFMASNSDTLLDGDGQSSDWIEIYNPTYTSINPKGWYLTDDESNLTKWQFPDANQLDPSEFMVVFASNKDDTSYPYIDPEGYCHTNFSLDKDGEYLALVAADGVTIAHEYIPEFPEQLSDISYGLLQNAVTLVSTGDETRYYVPLNSSNETTWMLPGFDDSTWGTEQTPLDFGLGDISSTGLVARYDFETGINDSSGNNLHGSLQGDAAIIPDSGGNGKTASNVLTVDGTGDYVDCGNDSVFNIGSNITVAAYAKNNSWVWGWAAVACKGNAWRLRRTETGLSDDTISFVCNGLNPFQVIGTTSVDDNQWHHLAGVYNGTDFSVYIDGQLDNSITATGTITPNTYELYIGASSHHGGDYAWNGLIDDVHIYERTLDLSEIQTLAGSGSPSALKSAMKGVNASLWTRIEFDVADDPNLFDSFVLRMKYEDGFVAYINGQEVARRNAPHPVQWNSTATSDRPIEDSLDFENINIMGHLNSLQVGTNTLGIHGLNDHVDNDDFLILPELVIARNQQTPQYFSTPTPGTFNVAGALGITSDVWFSHEHGFYDTSFDLILSTEMDDAEIRYTLDSSQPTITHGTVYSGPVTIGPDTTVVRAAAFRPGWLDSYVNTQTYIFLDDVIVQPNNPSGFPNDWKGNYYTSADLPPSQQVPADYEMDPDIVSGNETQAKGALLSLPTISIVTEVDNLFDLETGIYSNSWMGGLDWERPASTEYFDSNGTKEFQVNCGLRIHGGWFRKPLLTNKHSFRLLFKSDYGPTKLKYMMFDDEDATDSFDSIVLRAVGGDGYSFQSIGGRAQYLRDQFGRESQLDMGHTASHGIFAHLYIDGLYWGLYNVVERPEASFCETYFGGDKDNWDVIKIDRSTEQIAVANGSIDAWNEMLSQVRSGLSTNEAYQRIQGNNPDGTPNESYQDYLEIENYIDYMIANLYVGNTDWPQWNWYAVRDKSDGRTGFRFFMWDVEGSLDDGVHSYFGIDRTAVGSPTVWRAEYGPGVAEPYHELRNNAEFQMLFADHLHKAFFNGGPLTTDAVVDRYSDMANLIDPAMIGECARWGDQHFVTPFAIGHWRAERDRLLTNYFTVTSGDNRQEIVLEQFHDGGLYPSLYPDVPAPVFYINGSYQHGGYVQSGDSLAMVKPGGSGMLYYTLDGTDPREIGGGVNSAALTYSSGITLTETRHVKSRVLDAGEWSALNEAVFAIGPVAENLRITEIMYHPKYTNNPNDPNEEFIELKNIGTGTLNLNLVCFTKGIDFTFPNMTVAPGGYVVVVRDPRAFAAQYPGFSGSIAGRYLGKLDNAGERIQLEDAVGQLIQDFRYKDGWYSITDGEGFSLTIIDPDSSDPNNWDKKDGWRSSAYVGGSPGTDDTGQVPNPGAVVINEVLSHSDTDPNDWIELHNTTDTTIDISSWFLSDNDYNLTKYEIPPVTEITAGGYIVFTQKDHFGNSFALSENGETVCLSSGLAGELTGYREKEDFGASENNISFGRYLKSTGTFNFVSMSSKTSGTPNTYPKVGPIVISEIMYNPATNNQNLEYIELHNIESSAVTLYDSGKNLPWKFTDGIKFTFPSDPPVTIPAGGYLLVVKNPDTFASTYTFDRDILGPYDGLLSNGGEKVEISKPGDLDEYGTRYYIRVDRVNYSDGSNHNDFEGPDPWPTAADGNGSSLTRINLDLYGNDPNNWNATGPTLGSPPAQVLFINEFMAGNDTTIQDEYGEYDDWLEIYNASGSTVDLSGMYLADNKDTHLIPGGVTIGPGGHKIFWADGNTGQGDTHTNFNLGKGGDDITLFDTDGTTVLDSIIGFKAQTDDVSYGRYPDGVNNWGFFDSPTPAGENGRHSRF